MDDQSRIQRVLLEKFGLRARPQMGQYVLLRLGDGVSREIPIRAGEARTGVAVRRVLPVADLQSALQTYGQSA